MQQTDTHKPTPIPHISVWQYAEKIFHYILPLAVSVGLIIWLFRKVDFKDMIEVLKNGVNYWWLILMMIVLTLSRAIRGIRWGYQLRAAGIPDMPPIAEVMSIFGAYALNLVFSWVGEAWRCLYVARRQHTSLSTVVGTDIGDRASDAIVVMTLVFVSFFVARPALDKFLMHYAVGKDLFHFFTDVWIWCGLALIGLVIWAIAKFFSHCKYIENTEKVIKELWSGFKVLFTMNHKQAYWTLTLCIWICYFLETYLCFFAFPFLKPLFTDPGMFYGLVPGLIVFVFGSCSIAVPSTGGLGPWNLAVMFALSLYGISTTDAAAYSFVVWGFQTGIQIVLGIICALYVMGTKSSGSKYDKSGQ